MKPVIELRDVHLHYEGRPVLEEVDFSLANGEFCYLIGKTGSGKSSILKMLYRDVLPTAGSVRVGDFDVTRMPERKVPHLRRQLGIVFQDFQLLPDRSVYDNVAFALEVTGAKRSRIKERVIEVLSLVGLTHKRMAYPKDLSGGEQQRVVIARALANEPRILLADEPTGNLDPAATSSIMDVLHRINLRGMAVLMVTHDHHLVRAYPKKTVELDNGRLKNVSLM